MMLENFVREVAKAAGGRRTFNLEDRTLAPLFSLSNDRGQPATVVKWVVDACETCRFVASPALQSPERIVYVANRLGYLWPLLEAFYIEAAKSKKARSGILNLNLDDGPNLPGLSFCSNDIRDFLIPDPVFLVMQGYAATRHFFANGGTPYPARKPLAVWRGATTGHSPTGWRGLPRIKLCEIGARHPDLLDAGIAGVVQLAPSAEAEIRAAGLLGAHIKVEDFGAWQIQIDIDGNTNSWPGLFQKLLTGGPVVKVASPGNWRQWYYAELKPWENYVPVQANLEDLIEKIRWLRDHPARAAEIGMAGRDLALRITYSSALKEAVPVIAAALRAFA